MALRMPRSLGTLRMPRSLGTLRMRRHGAEDAKIAGDGEGNSEVVEGLMVRSLGIARWDSEMGWRGRWERMARQVPRIIDLHIATR